MIGTDEDIERRLQEQLEGPKEMFSAEERVRSTHCRLEVLILTE